MEFLTHSYNVIEIILKNLLGIIFLGFLIYLLVVLISNINTTRKYKIEKSDNNNNYSVKRCIDEGDRKKGRDHFYLIDEKNKKYHHINPYTLGKLGYPRPPRVEDEKDENKKFYFKKEDGYKLGDEIKIQNIISFINTIKDLKN